MLAAIGEDPVEDLIGLPPSGNTALAILRSTSRDTLEEGHWFNSETDYVLTPEPDGTIRLPDSILSVRAADRDVIERRPRLYDRESRSYKFDGPVTCDVILSLSWDELPSVARRYIIAVATERFVDGFPGAQAVTEARHRNLMRATVAFKKAEIRNGGYNLLRNPTIQQLTRR